MMRLSLPTAALLLSAASFAQDGGLYLAEDGLVVVEIESTPEVGDWTEISDSSGHTFASYYRWTGPDWFSQPGNGVIGYRLLLDQSGDWRLSLRNKHDHPDSTLENDVWVRMDGGTWFKLYSNGSQTVGVWNWVSRFDLTNDVEAGWNLPAGEHLLEFSGRSNGFMMDRFHLYREPNADGTNENAPESDAVLGERTCSPNEDNSSGRPGTLEVIGSTFVVKNRVSLFATDLPRDEPGYFLASQTPDFVPQAGGSVGNLCLGGQIARWRKKVKSSGTSGAFSIAIDLDDVPLGTPTAVQPGETWHFQAWFRDGQRSNLTDAVAVTFQ